MFNAYGLDRINEWKKFRDSLETENNPFQITIDFWKKAPFVANYLNPEDSDSWPDPWHLIIDGKFDDLAITLGILYTLKLTERFIGSNFEIHMAIEKEKEIFYFLIMDKKVVFDICSRRILSREEFHTYKSKLIYSL